MEIGKKYNRLTCISLSHRDSRHRKYFNFLCDCGKNHTCRSDTVKSGQAKSCGCLQVESRKTPQARERARIAGLKGGEKVKKAKGTASINQILYAYKYGAKERNLEFDLSREDFIFLTSQNCFYCGAIPAQSAIGNKNKRHQYNGDYIYNGIDRIDSSIGYIKSNCVTACKTCNIAKNKLNLGAFFKHIIKIYDYSNLGTKKDNYESK